MSSKAPIFPVPRPYHFSDYGFDPQIDYFQVLEEARNHRNETPYTPISAILSKLQKPLSRSDVRKRKKRWWKNALLFFKRKWVDQDLDRAANRVFGTSVSGPIYLIESRSGSSTPSRRSSRPSSGAATPTRKGGAGIPYLSLRELNMEEQHRISTSAVPPMPIYLVT